MQEDHLANLARMQSDRTRAEQSLNTRISDLESENKALKESNKRLFDELAALRARKDV